jgi:hypothetical protein
MTRTTKVSHTLFVLCAICNFLQVLGVLDQKHTPHTRQGIRSVDAGELQYMYLHPQSQTRGITIITYYTCV